MVTIQHSIRVASKRSGLTPHVIRVWERRYAAVEPVRTGTNRRLYTDRDIERLSLLRLLTASGHSIGRIASLSTDQLKELCQQNLSDNIPLLTPLSSSSRSNRVEEFLAHCFEATQNMDSLRLEQVLERAAVEFGSQGLLRLIIAPLTHRIGEMWYEGEISAAHEHFASSIVRVFLGGITRPFAISGNSPCLVVATPCGQLHELGAVMVGAAATNAGWRVTYLGASLPSAEIAGAVKANHARAVALSLVYPEGDKKVHEDLETLRRFLPDDVEILVGGRAARSYHETLVKIGATVLKDIDECCEHLRKKLAAK